MGEYGKGERVRNLLRHLKHAQLLRIIEQSILLPHTHTIYVKAIWLKGLVTMCIVSCSSATNSGAALSQTLNFPFIA